MIGVEGAKKVKDARLLLISVLGEMKAEHAELVLNYLKAQDQFDDLVMNLLLGLNNQLNEKK